MIAAKGILFAGLPLKWVPYFLLRKEGRIMKRGLLTLTIVAIALLCTSVYAYGPIIIDIPDVLIGDLEDNGPLGVPDINFFRFTNAFNFDKYVTSDPLDPDAGTTYPISVRWSFLATSTGVLKINGIETLSDPTESNQPELVLKELTSYPNTNPIGTEGRDTSWASFRDLVDSPEPDAPSYGNPTEATCLNTIITIYASNGTKADSEAVIVKANVDDALVQLPDGLSLPTQLIHVKDWTDPATDLWTKTLAMADNAFIARTTTGTPFYVGGHTTAGGNIRAAGSATQFVWASWDSPGTDVGYVANNVYRIQYVISSTQTDITKVPNCRLLTDFKGPSMMAITGGNRVGRGLFPPDADGNTYNVYVGPPDLSATAVNFLTMHFEVLDFDANESGINTMDECHVDRFATPDKTAGTLVKTYNTWTGWIPISLGSPIGNATLGSNVTGLYIQTPATPSRWLPDWKLDYGAWMLGADTSSESFEAAKMYRCVYTLKKASSGDNIGKIRMINANLAGDWNAKIALISDATQLHMPGISDTEYSVWYETMPALYADPNKNKMSYMLDVSDGNVAQIGRLYLTKVELYTYPIP